MDIGRLSEEEVCKYCMRCFFPEFVYSAPAFHRTKKQRELTDVLIWHDGTLVLIESKAKETTQVKQSWIEKTLTKANRQLRGAVRALRNSEKFVLINTFGVADNISFVNDIKDIIGIIVLNIHEPPKNLWDVHFRIREEDPPVLVFTLNEFIQALCEFDTTLDFIRFLFMVRTFTSKPFEAEFRDGLFVNMCKTYGLDLSKLKDKYKDIEDESRLAIDVPFPSVQEAIDAWNKRRAQFFNSYLIDQIIDSCRERIDDEIECHLPEQQTRVDGSPYSYRDVVYALSSFNREGRETLAKKVIAAHKKLISTNEPSLFTGISPGRKFGVSFRVDFKTDYECQKILLGTMLRNQADYKICKYLGVEILFQSGKIKFQFLFNELPHDFLDSMQEKLTALRARMALQKYNT